ncbi:phosphoadenylyl-sulfate reductase [Algivirga pacifica]|uniref:Adenosine 5'-phosphosulfate reductase n=1 Tax=Algivirga pacifica TaxID=1162670 RepID=A0ABP9D2J9_9BACT
MEYNFEQLKEEIASDIRAYKEKGLRLFSTSSFQPQSIVMLHIISQVDPDMPIFFMDTRYHFPETIAYMEEVKKTMKLNIHSLTSDIPKAKQVDAKGEPLYKADPEYCCHINKVAPLEAVLKEYDVWVNGVRKGQTANRANMGKEGKAKHDVLRYHPILEWDSKMVYTYINKYNLPIHPLVKEGYFSIGCTHCTAKGNAANGFDDRSGRWSGSTKTECGLHTTLVAG